MADADVYAAVLRMAHAGRTSRPGQLECRLLWYSAVARPMVRLVRGWCGIDVLKMYSSKPSRPAHESTNHY